MKRLFNYINNTALIKIASLNSVSVLIKIATGFLTSKAIAVFIGPEGFALIGNLRNFISSVQSISILGFYNGVVKYVAEFKNNTVELSKTISTAFYLGAISTISVSLLCYFNSGLINNFVFSENEDYAYIIKIFAIALPFYALNMFSFSIMNGFSKYKILIIINIIGQILGVSIGLILIYQKKIDGALISIVVSESLIFLITLVGILSRRNLVPLIKLKSISLSFFKKLSVFSVMALFSAIILPLTTMLVRSYIIDSVGYKEAGFWEAMVRISKYYLMFVSSLMTLYVLPRFSEINEAKDFRKEVLSFYKTIVPIFAVGLFVIYLLKSVIVELILTSEFKPVEDLFLWQLLGDFVKILSIVIACQFLAKKMFWHYILTEALSVTTIYLSSIYFINLYNTKGAVIAHFVSYLIYYVIILIIFRKSLFGALPKKLYEN